LFENRNVFVPLTSYLQSDREVSAAKAEAASVKATFNAQLQMVQNQLREEQESFELKLMMTASDAMERDNKNERMLKEYSKTIEELRRKLSQTEKQLQNVIPASEALGEHDDSTSAFPSIRHQLPVNGFSQKNFLQKSVPQTKRPRSDISQQPMHQNLRGCPMTPVPGESSAASRSQTQGSSVAGTPDTSTPLSIDAIRDLVRINSQCLQQRSISSEMRFIQICLRSGPISPFKQLLQALSESGALGESEALMHGAELLSSLYFPQPPKTLLITCVRLLLLFSTTESLSGRSCMVAFTDALFAWSLCTFPPVSLPALRCFVVLSSVAPSTVLSRLIVPGNIDQDDEKSNPPSCQPYTSFLESVDSILKRDPDAALSTLSMQLLVNIIPACRCVLIILLFSRMFYYG
jgi:hypothetical protein